MKIRIITNKNECEFCNFKNRKRYKIVKNLIKLKGKLLKGGGDIFYNDEERIIRVKFDDGTILSAFIKELGAKTKTDIKYE